MSRILERARSAGNGGALYRDFPMMLAPQLRIIFADLNARQGPDCLQLLGRSGPHGFATAMILSALGVPRETIVKDYHLSTQYRRPEFEMPRIDPAAFPGNPVTQFFASYQNPRGVTKPQPLYDKDGSSYLDSAFAEIEAKWGSVDAYLNQQVGVSAKHIAALRADYLE